MVFFSRRVSNIVWLGCCLSVASSNLGMCLSPDSSPRRFALLVGINRYADPRLPDLQGANTDVDLMKVLLTGEQGYGFSNDRVRVLLNEQATLGAFRKELARLAKQATSEDIVLIYFSGHGSQVQDQNGDEADDLDETLVFHDSRSRDGTIPDLADDELHCLLSQIKARHLVLILDAGNTGTVSRGGETLSRQRFAPKLEGAHSTSILPIQGEPDQQPDRPPKQGKPLAGKQPKNPWDTDEQS